MTDGTRARYGLAAGIGAALVVFAFAMFVLAVVLRQDVLVALLPSVPLAAILGAIFRMTVDDDWPAFRRRANEAEANREIDRHRGMFALPSIDLGTWVPEGDEATREHELRVVLSHRRRSERRAGVR